MDDCEKRGYLEGDFRLFHLSDQAMAPIAYHYHEFDKIIILLRGGAEYVVEGKAYRLQPYDILLVRHHEIHQPRALPGTPYERIIVYLSPSFISSCSDGPDRLDACFSRADGRPSSVIRLLGLKNSRMFQAIKNLEDACLHHGYAEGLYQRLLFLEFMVHLNRAALENHIEYVKKTPGNQKVLEIMEYLHENLTQDISIDRLSEHFFISKYHMMRLFKQETGYTIGDYIAEKRLLLARDRMSQGIPLTELAFDCGFKNYPAFLRAYKKFFGKAPLSSKKTGIS